MSDPAGGPPGPWRMHRLDSADALLPLGRAVDALVRQRAVPNPFLTVEYLAPTAAHATEPLDLRVIYRDDRLVGLLPVCRARGTRFGLRWPRVSFPHTAPQMPADWILDPAEEGLAAWVCSALGAERVWADAYFARVPADSPLLGLSGRPDVRVRRALAPFVTRLAPTWDAQLRAYSRKRRKHIRHVERLDKFGPAARVRIACFPEEDDDLERLLADVGTVVRQTWKARTVDIDRYCRLTGDVMRGMARRDRLVAFLLRDGDRPLAYFANLALAGRLFPYVTAFHPDAAAGSPGALLIAATLRYGCAHGYREVHFGSDRPHVSHWARERSAYYHVRLFNDTVRGRLLRALSGRAA